MAKSFYSGGSNFISADDGSHFGSVVGDFAAGMFDKHNDGMFKSTACENNQLKLTCGSNKIISAASASFGRLSMEVCVPEDPTEAPEAFNNTACTADVSAAVRMACEGKSSCTIASTTAALGVIDPCYSTYKYALVNCTCELHL